MATNTSNTCTDHTCTFKLICWHIATKLASCCKVYKCSCIICYSFVLSHLSKFLLPLKLQLLRCPATPQCQPSQYITLNIKTFNFLLLLLLLLLRIWQIFIVLIKCAKSPLSTIHMPHCYAHLFPAHYV